MNIELKYKNGDILNFENVKNVEIDVNKKVENSEKNKQTLLSRINQQITLDMGVSKYDLSIMFIKQEMTCCLGIIKIIHNRLQKHYLLTTSQFEFLQNEKDNYMKEYTRLIKILANTMNARDDFLLKRDI